MARIAPASAPAPLISAYELSRLRITLGRAKVLVGNAQASRSSLYRAHTEFWAGGAATAYRNRVEELALLLAAVEEAAQTMTRCTAHLLTALEEVQGQ